EDYKDRETRSLLVVRLLVDRDSVVTHWGDETPYDPDTVCSGGTEGTSVPSTSSVGDTGLGPETSSVGRVCVENPVWSTNDVTGPTTRVSYF
ncbi:Hypothetical predicted protein, partial [Marmota monax]